MKTRRNVRVAWCTRGCLIAIVLACTSGASVFAQFYPLDAELRFEVWDGAAWSQRTDAHAGGRVE
jgi:hypothetical protein